MPTVEASEKDAVVRLRLPSKLKAKAEAKARRAGMTMSRYLRALVEADLAKQPLTLPSRAELEKAIETLEAVTERLRLAKNEKYEP
jgi:antitoxin component of RelBE/YafQ-DinJ toxin-antitoxin module